jgi:hypothetical protein
MRLIRSGLFFVFTVATLTYLTGCPNPTKTFDDFVRRQESLDLSASAPDGGGTLADISGRFLFSVRTTLAPQRPLQLIAEVTFTQNATGGSFDIELQPLSYPARMLVGTKQASRGNPVMSDGSLTITANGLAVPGDANPIIFGSNISADLVLSGVIRTADRFCGDRITGVVRASSTISDFTGWTWGAIRVPANAIGDELPQPDTTCPAEEPMPDMAPPPDMPPPLSDGGSDVDAM